MVTTLKPKRTYRKPDLTTNQNPTLEQIFDALKNPERIAILRLLAGSERLTVEQMSDRLFLDQGGVSYHLRVLRKAGLVDPCTGIEASRDLRKRFYNVRASTLNLIVRLLLELGGEA